MIKQLAWLLPTGAWLAVPLDAQSIVPAFKQAYYTQTSAAGAVPTGAPFSPYGFGISSPTAGTLTPPGLAARSLASVPSNQDYEIKASFASKSALAAAYPDGSYAFTPAGLAAISFPLSGDLFPAAIPAVVGGTWQNNALLLDPTKSNTITLSAFAGYGTYAAGSHMEASLYNANNTDSVSLQQQYSTLAIPGITQSATPFTSFVIPANTLKAPGIYELDVTYTGVSAFLTSGSVTVAAGYQNSLVTYVIVQSGTAPRITLPPSNITFPLGSTAVFNASVTFASGTAGQNGNQFGWLFNGSEIQPDQSKHIFGYNGPGSLGNANLGISSLTAADAGTYTLQVFSGTGYLYSQSVTLSIGAVPPPTINVQPVSAVMVSGATTVLSVGAGGSGLSFQWLLNGAPVSGATNARYVFTAAAGTAGTYACRVTNSAGSVTSDPASVTLATGLAATTGAGRLVNLSVNANIGSGLTLGFVTGGPGTSGQTPLLIRAAGPALQAFNVPGTLPDPLLTLFNSQSLPIASNSGWGANQLAIAAANALTGAFAFNDPQSLDAALLSTLSGLNTVSVTGKSNDSGQALAEVYDATPAYTVASPRLINLSCNAHLDAGGTLTVGFVILGSTSKTVLIRATGPALAAFGVPNVLPDPKVTLYNVQSQPIAANAGWGGDSQINAAGAKVGAFTLTDPSSADSVIIKTLPPGNYTASATSPSGAAGSTLIEVYEIF